jgi:hypothetical protein
MATSPPNENLDGTRHSFITCEPPHSAKVNCKDVWKKVFAIQRYNNKVRNESWPCSCFKLVFDYLDRWQLQNLYFTLVQGGLLLDRICLDFGVMEQRWLDSAFGSRQKQVGKLSSGKSINAAYNGWRWYMHKGAGVLPTRLDWGSRGGKVSEEKKVEELLLVKVHREWTLQRVGNEERHG